MASILALHSFKFMRNKTLLLVTLLSLLTIASFYSSSCGSSEPSFTDRVKNIQNRSQTTSNGVKIWVENGASVSVEEKTAIEEGLNEVFNRARLRNYSAPLTLPEYTVAIMGNSERAPESGIWCYRLPAGAYAGTPWDLGGYILAAGATVFYSLDNPSEGNVMAIPDHKQTHTPEDLANLSRVVAYEAEHIILRHSDFPLWQATKVHTPTTGHPLF